MNGVEVILIPIMLIFFISGIFIQKSITKCVSREKLLEVEDLSKLWRNSIPPKEVLNDKGLKLYRYLNIGAFVFGGICFFMVALGFIKGALILFSG